MISKKSVKTYHKRPSWDSYFLNLAEVVAERSNCIRRKVGVVVVQDRHIIATGYSGTPAGIKNCFDGGCKRCMARHENTIKENERKDLCICIHAEQNSILQSAYHGVSTHGATLYSTIAPCIQCAKAIINAGIKRVVFESDYQDDLGKKLLKEAGIEVQKYRT